MSGVQRIVSGRAEGNPQRWSWGLVSGDGLMAVSLRRCIGTSSGPAESWEVRKKKMPTPTPLPLNASPRAPPSQLPPFTHAPCPSRRVSFVSSSAIIQKRPLLPNIVRQSSSPNLPLICPISFPPSTTTTCSYRLLLSGLAGPLLLLLRRTFSRFAKAPKSSYPAITNTNTTIMGEQSPKAPVVAEAHAVDTFHPPQKMLDKHPSKPHLSSLEEYQKLYKESITEPKKFWGRLARELLTWSKDFQTVHSGSLAGGDNAWFLEGELNASYNCVDRHAFKDPNKVAVIYEADEPSDGRNVTYGELLRDVSKLAHVLTQMGVRKGDTVAIYLPMIPEAIVALLACSRIGAVHSVVFAGFSADSLRDRVIDGGSKVVITTDEGKRGGKLIGTKKIVDEALKQCPDVGHVLVYKRTGADIPMTEGRDFWWHEEVEKWPSYYPPVAVNSEDPLFLLYTSGSTGKPKGVMHTTGGYLLGAATTGKYVFDIHDGDRYFCGGDVGWITGHTYVVYAPLLLGVSTVVFEGTPAYPNFSRYWDIIEQHKVTQFYVAPTALRLLKRAGNQHVRNEMKHLRVLGSVGEPIAAEIWKWYFEVVGKEEAHIVDTYWQTETGSNVITPLAGVTPTKPGSASLPFFGIEPAIVDPVSGEEIHGNDVEGVLAFKQPWPSMARTVWGAHKRYMDTYLNVYKGYYFTGDGAGRDHEGFYWIRGRVDDVVNVSGHRLSTAEIEAALIEHASIAEAAVVGVADELTGQAVNAFVSIKNGAEVDDALRKDFILQVRRSIGPFAAPKAVFVVPDLPKTRSGKIMRRILRKILAGEEDQLGDISTLSDPSVVEKIINIVHEGKKK
ncbi:acetyl-coenzyme A synthetase 2 [Podospora pseudocomata]|uniref:Acetyl-coenzyme A synthetase n=1 Tax=Podospora pseudocomata TaxID=2093779 RepID=A0ABR0GJS0_9PEZI|nr:acetyl-coenzyme A synthetase 2 [Podospora pseudocomata]